jgi:hypothetical protein
VIRRVGVAVLVPILAVSGPALADTHVVTVQNGTGEAVRSIVISPSAGTGESRLRSTLPPGAVARLTYSTGCQANVRIGYDSGRTEDHPGVDVCSDPRIVAGTEGVAGPTVAAAAPAATAKPAASKTTATSPAVAPLPVVPPWTGKSITKRFGGMD